MNKEEVSISGRFFHGIDAVYLDVLEKGEIITDRDDKTVLDCDDQPMRRQPSAAMMNSIRAWYKERLTQNAGVGEDIDPVEKALNEIRAGRETGTDLPDIPEADDSATK
jgi:hypothetical protein